VQIAGKRITEYGIALLAIVLIGAFLRVYNLGTQSIWIDEAYTIFASTMSVPRMVAEVANGDFSPPLYHFLLHFWMMIFGTSEAAARLLSVLFGVLAIPIIYLVGRQLFNKDAGLIAALILALSSFNIFYSQELRMYSLMVLLALLSMYFFLCFLQRSTLASSAGYVLSTTLLLYTHYYGLFVVLAQNIYVVALLLLTARSTFKLRQWVTLEAFVVALFAPWIGVFAYLGREPGLRLISWVPLPTPSDFVTTFVAYAGTALLLIIFVLLSFIALFRFTKITGTFDWKGPLKTVEAYSLNVRFINVASVLLLVVWLFTLNVIPYVVSQVTQPIYYTRYAIAGSVAFYLLVAGGIRNVNGKFVRFGVIAVIIMLSAANLPSYYMSNAKGQAREATSLIDTNAQSGDVVLVFPDTMHLIFDYYNNRTDIAVKQISPFLASSDNENKTREMIYSNVTRHNRVFLFASGGIESQKAQRNFILSVLNESYAKTYVKSYYAQPYNYDVYLYEKRA
jgi:uncharacterized membrane protein